MAADTPTYNFIFSEPKAHIIENQNKTYYMQDLTFNNSEVQLATDWFTSDGPRAGLDNKSEMLYVINENVRSTLQQIEAAAVQQLKVPVVLLQQNNVSPNTTNEMLYRPLYGGNSLFSKLHRNCVYFNNRALPIEKQDLGFGEYKVLIRVTGIYIGYHSQEKKLASLHIRIHQIQYRELNVPCLLNQSSGLIIPNSQNLTPMAQAPQIVNMNTQPPPAIQPQHQPSTSAGKKSSRKQTKPVLQRQNAMEDMSSMMQAANVPSGNMDEFFANLNVEMLE